MVLKSSLYYWLKQPVFWIILFGLFRLYGITNEPIETAHNWRQVTGLMVARNFTEIDANILYPRVDMEGGEEEIIGMEFPLLNYLHYIISLFFGYDHWYGRIINLLITSIGVCFFSRLIKDVFSEKIALYSTLAFLGSIFFAYSRKMMPDTFSIALCLIGFYYLNRFFQEKNKRDLILYAVFACLGILSKLPAILCLSPAALYFFSKDYSNSDKKSFLLSSLALILPVYWWYFQWNPALSEKYGSWYNSGMSFREGVAEILSHLGAVAQNFYFHSFYSFGFFGIFLLGLFFAFKTKDKRIIYSFLIYFGLGIIYILKAGFFFHHHNYYIIPLVPMMALLAGYGLTQVKSNKIIIALLLLSVGESVANQQHDFTPKQKNIYKLKLEEIISKNIPQNDKLIVKSEGSPQLLYFSNRKGWLRSASDLSNQQKVDELIESGADFLLVDQHEGSFPFHAKVVYEDEDFILYDLSKPK